MSNTIFADGISVYTPNEKAPDFVKCSLVIRFEQLSKWLADNENFITEDKDGNPTLRLQIKESKQGNLYASVDTYQPDGVKVIAQTAREKAHSTTDNIGQDDLPF